MKKVTIYFQLLLIFLLTGCFSTPKQTDKFTVNMDKAKAEQIVYTHATHAWARSANLYRDAFMVEKIRWVQQQPVSRFRAMGMA